MQITSVTIERSVPPRISNVIRDARRTENGGTLSQCLIAPSAASIHLPKRKESPPTREPSVSDIPGRNRFAQVKREVGGRPFSILLAMNNEAAQSFPPI